jgi:hypothetical protein
MLDYDKEATAPLEFIVCRNFTVDVEVQDKDGTVKSTEVELLPGGKDIEVTF